MKNCKLIIAAILVFGVFFTSCKKDLANSELTLDLTKTANITVKVRYLKDVNSASYTTIPSGKMVTLKIYNSDFTDLDASGYWSTIVNTDASGNITATVPATIDGVDVIVQVQAFQDTQVDFSDDVINGFYSASEVTTNLKIGDDKVVGITMDFTDPNGK